MGNITIFFKNEHVVGSCALGQESEWIKDPKGGRKDYDRTLQSTDERWHAWARHRAKLSYHDDQLEREAQALL